MINPTLLALGWNSTFQDALSALDNLEPARVAVVHNAKNLAVLVEEHGALTRYSASLSGKLLESAETSEDLPATGDFVAVSRHAGGCRIEALLPRQTVVSRFSPDGHDVQVLVANANVVAVVTSMNQDLNERRLERYLTAISGGGARPIVILSKADLSADPWSCTRTTASHLGLDPDEVIACSVVDGTGLDEVEALVQPGETLALLGSSGVGKSSLVNALTETEQQLVRGIRGGDDKGRHTTTARELILLKSGRIVVDTPGMRELALATSSQVDDVFEEILEHAANCRFRDCTHQHEPGCAVREAVESGDIAEERWASYMKLWRESTAAERRKAHIAVMRSYHKHKRHMDRK